MPTMTQQNLIDDLARLWKHDSRSSLRYIVEVSDPVVIDEHDEAILAMFSEAHDAEAPIVESALALWRRLGINPDSPAYDLNASFYNFMRPTALAQAWLKMADQEIAELEQFEARYAEGEALEVRLMRYLVGEMLELRRGTRKKLEKVLRDALAAAGADVAVEEEEETELVGVGGEFPWHDEGIGLDDRMKLAEGRGLFEKLYAAMAQTDCTACGYDCEGYARAIADGEDTDLTKCAPGELETQEMLEKLMGK